MLFRFLGYSDLGEKENCSYSHKALQLNIALFS